MGTVRRPFPDTFRRAPPCNPATPFEKGVDPKTFSVDGQHTFYGRAKNPECRSREFSEISLWTPCTTPSRTLFAGLPPCNPATPFEKGVDPKTFSADKQHPFNERVKNPECRNNGFPGTDLWIPVAVPSVGVLCFRAWWEASSESPWVFDDASRLHDLKRPSLFRRDKVPARNTHRPSGFAFTHREKFLRDPRGVFSKTLRGREWDRVPQKERASQPSGHAFSGGTKSFHETPTDRPAWPSRT